jgi:hypothetical protein
LEMRARYLGFLSTSTYEQTLSGLFSPLGLKI